ncbi:MAG: hypothetical protein Q8S84_09290 [bacterium]|nr:hypothetical protein [bacterium]
MCDKNIVNFSSSVISQSQFISNNECLLEIFIWFQILNSNHFCALYIHIIRAIKSHINIISAIIMFNHIQNIHNLPKNELLINTIYVIKNHKCIVDADFVCQIT